MSASVGPAGILSSPLPVSDNLWNTQYIDAALDQLRRADYPLADDDVARLSPLVFSHINFLGRYAFTAPPRGVLRSLRDPDAADDEEDE